MVDWFLRIVNATQRPELSRERFDGSDSLNAALQYALKTVGKPIFPDGAIIGLYSYSISLPVFHERNFLTIFTMEI